MSKASWKKSSDEKDIESEKQAGFSTPSKFMLVTCRRTTDDENKTLSKNFKSIMVYNAQLTGSDLQKLDFDLLIVDVSHRANHLFLEMASPAATALNIPIIVLKKSLTNYAALVEALDAYVVSSVAAMEGDDFLKFLVKDKLPKFQGRCVHFLERLWAYVTK